MTIIKNEPLFPHVEGDYAKPRHIIVAGSNEEIGFDLGTLAKTEFGVSELYKYDDPIYGEARNEMLKNVWPAMHERSKGVLRAYGLPKDDCVHDATSIPCHIYDSVKNFQLEFAACSAVCLPVEKSKDGKGVFTARNHDLAPKPMWSWMFGKPGPEGAVGAEERPSVIEFRPDTGYRTIVMGGHNVLVPFIDGINEKGLYITALADNRGVGEAAGPMAGHEQNGVTAIQIISMLLDTCANVREAKVKILSTRILQAALTMHWLLVDAEGNATIFNIDKVSQCYIFTDRKPNEPLIATNHAVSYYNDPAKFPKYEEGNEHNTFWRMNHLHKWYDNTKAKEDTFTMETAAQMIDTVHTAFQDDKMAQCQDEERTLMNTHCDLSKPSISCRFYLGDVGPVEGTNHVKTRMSEFYTFTFE